MLHSFEEIPSAELAKVDQMKVDYSLGRLRYTDHDDLGDFCRGLCPPPHHGSAFECWGNLTAAGEAGPHALWGWMFINPQSPRSSDGQATGYRTIDIRSKRKNSRTIQAGLPLWSGKLRLRPCFHTTVTPSSSISAELYLNPTRWAFHQRPQETLFTTSRVPTIGGETSLTGNDNVILGRRKESFFSHTANWENEFDKYLTRVFQNLHSEIERSAWHSNARFTLMPSIKLSKAEIYWEVRQMDAVAEMNRIKPILMAMGRRSMASIYSALIVEGREVLSPSLTVPLAEGITLKIYAKTDRRIRAEIAYDLKKCSVLTSEHTSGNFRAILQWVNDLQHDASARMTRVFQCLRHTGPVRPLLDLIRGVIRASANTEESLLIFSQLLTRQCFDKVLFGSSGASIERRLKADAILRRNPVNGGPSVLHPDFMWLADFPPTL